MVNHIDAAAESAHKVLVETAHDEQERMRLIKDRESRARATEQLAKHRQVFLEIILVRHVENYLSFLSSVLFEIFVQRPETLKSSEKVELDVILTHDSVESLVRSMAERKVESLSYKSFGDLNLYFQERFSIPLFDDNELPAIIEAIETRNISVHNRCIINQRFLSRTNGHSSLLGHRKDLYIQHNDGLVPLLAKSVKSVDQSARKRLKLKGIRFRIDPFAN